MLIYPVTLTSEPEGVSVSFPDVPEALTYGADRTEALAQASDALLTALMIYQDERRAFPMPSKARSDFVEVPVMAALKIFLHNAMIEKGMRKVDLARLTGWANPQVERALDPRYQSRVPLIEDALHKLGKTVIGHVIGI